LEKVDWSAAAYDDLQGEQLGTYQWSKTTTRVGKSSLRMEMSGTAGMGKS